MGVDISASDLLNFTIYYFVSKDQFYFNKLKNTDAAFHLYIDQCDILGMHDTGFLPISDRPIFFNSFWQIPIYFLFFGNNTKSLLCRNYKKYNYNFG